jgi:hypothetical protein
LLLLDDSTFLELCVHHWRTTFHHLHVHLQVFSSVIHHSVIE